LLLPAGVGLEHGRVMCVIGLGGVGPISGLILGYSGFWDIRPIPF